LHVRSTPDVFACELYPVNTVIPPGKVNAVLEVFKRFRLADATVYLRPGSINIINGMIGLDFSCDGSYYIDYREFLDNCKGDYF
jgi:hypothetical protein